MESVATEPQTIKRYRSPAKIAAHAVYAAWKTGKPVPFLFRGEVITATPDTLVCQLVAEMSAAKLRAGADA